MDKCFSLKFKLSVYLQLNDPTPTFYCRKAEDVKSKQKECSSGKDDLEKDQDKKGEAGQGLLSF